LIVSLEFLSPAPTFVLIMNFITHGSSGLTQLALKPKGLYMFKNPFKRSKSMAAEQNEQAQDLGQEQADQQTAQTQAETEQAEVSVEDLQAQITNLTESLKLEKARTANAVYEAQKSVERIQRDAEKHKETVIEKFAKELLDTVDNLERAIQAAGDTESPLLEGVQLTLKSLLTTLEKFGVVEVNMSNGFNADLHQAVGIAPDAKAGEIGTVLQKGYTLSNRLLRPAMVLVGQ
jgi:molecular chaperone GrpE